MSELNRPVLHTADKARIRSVLYIKGALCKNVRTFKCVHHFELTICKVTSQLPVHESPVEVIGTFNLQRLLSCGEVRESELKIQDGCFTNQQP